MQTFDSKCQSIINDNYTAMFAHKNSIAERDFAINGLFYMQNQNLKDILETYILSVRQLVIIGPRTPLPPRII